MHSFTDTAGRDWKLEINVAAMRRAKTQGIDLSMPVSQMQEFVMDDVFLTDALYAVVHTQAETQGISLQQFESSLNGEILAQARDCLWEALAEYFDPGKAEMLRAAIAATKAEMRKASVTLTGFGESKGS
ncbi:MAG TPA: hypothetical protein DDW52_10235 [Planctomycetaceae bacterium]|nr:hypothetical protein [Planctomycetaceae bacterium]